jgi:hypothetical protein
LIIPSVDPIPKHSESLLRKLGIKNPAKVLSEMSIASIKVNVKFAVSSSHRAPSPSVPSDVEDFINLPNLRRLGVLIIDLRSQLVPSGLSAILGFANFSSVDFPSFRFI